MSTGTPPSLFRFGDTTLMWQDPCPESRTPCSVRAPSHGSLVQIVPTQLLGQLKACVHAYSIAQLVTQDALFTVVGQLEQVEAC